jgi:COMPASS component SWD1
VHSWSGDGRYLLSAARDWKCVVWDLKDGSRVRTVTLDGPIWSADFDPNDQYADRPLSFRFLTLMISLRFVASVLESDPLLVDLHGTSSKRYILPTTLPTLSTSDNDKVEAKKPAEYTLVAVFDRSGSYIYTGTNKGHFNVIDVETREVLYCAFPKLTDPPLACQIISSLQCSN